MQMALPDLSDMDPAECFSGSRDRSWEKKIHSRQKNRI